MIFRHASRALPVLLMVALPISPIWAARQARPEATPAGKQVVTSTGLRYIDEKIGNGTEAGPGKTVEVLYTGWLEDNTKFDSSLDPEHPFRFRIGIDEVIQGWHEGITGMRPGGRRRLIVPPELGYGSQGAGGVVPGNATLVFEVELLAVK